MSGWPLAFTIVVVTWAVVVLAIVAALLYLHNKEN